MPELTYRDAVARGIAQEMARDPDVVFLGEDVGKAGGVFKATVGLYEQFGPLRVRDTPISEQAILGMAMGAAMTGMRPVAEIMFSDFLAVCWDLVANEIAKTRYMTDGQISLPLVIRTANGGGIRFGAQHSQSLENWAMAVPGLKVVAPATPADAKGLLKAAIRDDDPVIFIEQERMYGQKGEVSDDPEFTIPLGVADIKREGTDATIVARSLMVPVALKAAEILQKEGFSCEVIDPRTIRPLDIDTIIESVKKTNRVVVAEESHPFCGIAAEISAEITERAFDYLDAPVKRVSGADVPMPYAKNLEDLAIPGVDQLVAAVREVAYLD